jgi:probable phosphoglycerate mutase
MNPTSSPDASERHAPGRIFLLRHGVVQSPEEEKCYVGQQDLPLSDRGFKQAAAWADYFAHLALGAIYSSDLSRCRETARIIGDRCRLAPQARPALREINLGDWEGQPLASIKRRDPKAYQLRGEQIADYRPPGGESFRDLDRRVWPFFKAASRQPRGPTLMVTHAGVIRVLICRLLGMPLENLFTIGQAFAALTIIDAQPEGFRLQALNLPLPMR